MTINKGFVNTFKTTFLFGFVQVFNVIAKLIVNKFIAYFLGAAGMGVIGIFNNAINLLKTGGGLGISQSAVRDISEASGDEVQYSFIISLVKKLLLYSSIFGIVLSASLSPLLSSWAFNTHDYTYSFLLLSLVVGINIYTEGQLSILKGSRQLKMLAKCSMMGVFIGSFGAIPCYYYFGMKGIVPSIVIGALVPFLFSNYFVSKLKYSNISGAISFQEFVGNSKPIVKMGIALMYVTFLGALSDLILSFYVSNYGGLSDVGCYQAGIVIISGYFGIVITAMSTDYYPRISAVHSDNIKLKDELNTQTEVGLVIAFPLIVLFLFLSPVLVQILYSTEFIRTIEYADFAVLGMLIIMCSNCLGMILLAKQNSKIFIYTSTAQRTLGILLSILLYNYFGLKGLGISYLIMAVVHFVLMSVIMKYRYNIEFTRRIYAQLFCVLIISIIAMFAKDYTNIYWKYSIGIFLFLFSLIFSFRILKKRFNFKFGGKFRS